MRLDTEYSTSFALGVNDSGAPDEYLPQQVQRLVNARVSRQGNGIEVPPGIYPVSGVLNQSGGIDNSNIYGGIEFYTAAGVQQLVLFANDEMQYSTDAGVTWTVAASSLDEAYWSLVIYREGSSNVLCCANGGTNSYQWDGTTWSTIANIPSGTKYLAVLGDRLVSAGGDGVTVAASKVSDIDNGYGATDGGYTVKATTHDGDVEIKGLFTIGSILMVFKRKSVGYIEGFGYETLQVAAGARGLSRSTGCVAFRTIAPCGDNGVMWLSERGFEFYQLGGPIELASRFQQGFVDRIAYGPIQTLEGIPNAAWWPARHEYFCAVPLGNGLGSAGVGNTRNSWVYVYRPAAGGAPPAVHHRYPTTAVVTAWDVGSFVIDENSELDMVADSFTGLMGFVDANGELDVGPPPTPGLWAAVDDFGRLDLWAPEEGPSALFVADDVGSGSKLWYGSHGNRLYIMEDPRGTVDLAIIRTRPYLFGDQSTRKKAKRGTVIANQPQALTGTLYPVIDGVYGAGHSLSYTQSTGTATQERRGRLGGRGRVVQIEYHVSAEQSISQFDCSAQILSDQP